MKPFFEIRDIWCPNAEYSNHRIPGIIVTGKGTLLIYCEARREASDWAMMDILHSADSQLPDPQCFGSVSSYNDGEHPYSLLFVNCNSTEKRENVTVRVSIDNGKTYGVSRQIDESRGGYVDIAVDNNAKRIYALYEDKFGITDHLAIFNYEWILEK